MFLGSFIVKSVMFRAASAVSEKIMEKAAGYDETKRTRVSDQ